jgi:hypothetical protein
VAHAIPGNKPQLCKGAPSYCRQRRNKRGGKRVTGAMLQEHVAGGLRRVNAHACVTSGCERTRSIKP